MVTDNIQLLTSLGETLGLVIRKSDIHQDRTLLRVDKSFVLQKSKPVSVLLYGF